MKLFPAKVDWNVWKPRALYGAFTALAFLVALRATFPSEAVKERLIYEAGRRGWQIDVERVSAGGLLGVTAEGVKLDNGSGLAVPIESLTASVRVLPLLVGRRSVAFDARLYDGRVRGRADLGDATHVVAQIQGVDLGASLPLRKASGVDLVGKLGGSADVTLPAGQRPTGHVDLTLDDAGVAGGQLPIPGMAGGLALPKIGFGQITAALELAGGRATFQKLEARGGDAEITTEGLSFAVQPRMEFAPLSGKAKVKVKDAFWSKSGTQAFKGMADMALASSRGPDGAWHFTVTGSVGHPRVQPVPPGR